MRLLCISLLQAVIEFEALKSPLYLRTLSIYALIAGHDYRGRLFTTIAEEKKHNARLAGKTREQFVEIMNNLKLGACCN